jgi:manganese/zinc/iron transport system permease protein
MVLLAGILGAFAGVIGAVTSSLGGGIPTGPTIVLVASLLVALSLLAAPRRGLGAELVRRFRVRRRVRAEVVLGDLYALAAQHDDPTGHGHSAAVLRTMQRSARGGDGEGGVEKSLRALASRGLARELDPDEWALTDEGVSRARKLLLPGSDEGDGP